MKLNIETYGAETLRRNAQPVMEITDEIRALIANMLETMHAAQGIGLAAAQVGRREAVCVIDIPSDMQDPTALLLPEMPLILLNPEIVEASGEQCAKEGCLSFPELYVSVNRAAVVTVSYLDRQGVQRMFRAEGLLARAVQHELDHLHGVLLVDKMTSVQKVAAAAKLRRIKKLGARTFQVA